MAKGGGKKSAKALRDAANKLLADNRFARHQYEVLETLECGLELLGTEVKSIRAGQVNLRDGFCLIRKGELQLHNVHISPHSHAGAPAWLWGEMCTLCSWSSPLRIRQKPSRRFTCPARIDFTSVPSNSSPHSRVSRTSYWWRAKRLSASSLLAASRRALALFLPPPFAMACADLHDAFNSPTLGSSRTPADPGTVGRWRSSPRDPGRPVGVSPVRSPVRPRGWWIRRPSPQTVTPLKIR